MNHIMLLNYSLYDLLFYFFIYAFIGWAAEVGYAALSTGKFVNRGFLNGPVCPIYGIGIVTIVMLLTPISDNLIIFFIFSVLITSILEYATGLILEKLFHDKWWDYSNYPYNLGGYICLKFSLLWGAACMLVVKIVHPVISRIVAITPMVLGNVLLIIASSVLIADVVVTVISIVQMRNRFKEIMQIAVLLRNASDSMGEVITEQVLKAAERQKAFYENRNMIYSRIEKAFPRLPFNKYRESFEYIAGTIQKTGARIEKQVEEREKKAREQNEKDTKSFAYGMNFYKIFWIFFIGSIAGVVVETIWCILTKHTIESRAGVIYGPFNPVYGFGAALITICLYKLRKSRDLWIFLGSMGIGAAFEYVCSLFQELTFGTVSWEYSNTFLNLDGRTNLMFAFFWGILGMLWVKDVYPHISRYIQKIPNKIGVILTWVLLVFMVLNMTVSAAAVYRQTERHNGVPATNAITRYIDKVYTDDFLKRIYPNMITSKARTDRIKKP